jgi:hypothetical protein
MQNARLASFGHEEAALVRSVVRTHKKRGSCSSHIKRTIRSGSGEPGALWKQPHRFPEGSPVLHCWPRPYRLPGPCNSLVRGRYWASLNFSVRPVPHGAAFCAAFFLVLPTSVRFGPSVRSRRECACGCSGAR